LFFLLICCIALFQTDFWRHMPVQQEVDTRRFRVLFPAVAGLILAQLILGATMRHQHAGLAIPDFPAAYGKLWPDTDAAAIWRYNQHRNDILDYNPITAAQVQLQMIHRLLALLIFVAVAACAWRAWRFLGWRHSLARFSAFWFGLVLTQVFLGAATIWTKKSADVATAHVACGAVCLVTGGLASVISFRLLAARAAQTRPMEKNEVTSLMASSSITAE
jgi:cytochrome c oxidase assembly protein subunit 15